MGIYLLILAFLCIRVRKKHICLWQELCFASLSSLSNPDLQTLLTLLSPLLSPCSRLFHPFASAWILFIFAHIFSLAVSLCAKAPKLCPMPIHPPFRLCHLPGPTYSGLCTLEGGSGAGLCPGGSCPCQVPFCGSGP